MSYRPRDPHEDTTRLLALAERLYDAIMARDVDRVYALLAASAATSVPREVREEALEIVALAPGSYRVPMTLLRYHHRLGQLARGDALGDAAPAPDPAQMEIPFARDRVRWRTANGREGNPGGLPRDRVEY